MQLYGSKLYLADPTWKTVKGEGVIIPIGHAQEQPDQAILQSNNRRTPEPLPLHQRPLTMTGLPKPAAEPGRAGTTEV
jgi:hypothetical protein